jgi:hypothetical protein
MPIFEYKCPDCGGTQDVIVLKPPRPALVPCACGKQAVFQISAPHLSMRMGMDSIGSPTQARRWEKAHTEKLKAEQRKANG